MLYQVTPAEIAACHADYAACQRIAHRLLNLMAFNVGFLVPLFAWAF